MSIIILAITHPSPTTQMVSVDTSAFMPPERLGFFKITTTLENYIPPGREIIFIIAPDKPNNNLTVPEKILKSFLPKMNADDSFNILFPIDAFGEAGGELRDSLDIHAEDRPVTVSRWMFPESVPAKHATQEFMLTGLDPINKAVPVNRPQDLINLIESAISRTRQSDKAIVEIIVIFAHPESWESKIIGIPGLFSSNLDTNSLIDIGKLSDAMSLSGRLPRLSSINYGGEGPFDRQFRLLAHWTNGFFLDGPEPVLAKNGGFSSHFQFDFLRNINIRLSRTGANYIHNDMWDTKRQPNVLTLVGRCSNISRTILTIEDLEGKTIHEVKIGRVPNNGPDLPAKWAELRAGDARRNVLNYDADSFIRADLNFLKREWDIDLRPLSGLLGMGTESEQNFAKAPKPAGKSSKETDKETFEGNIPPHSAIAKIVPEDSLYMLFSSVPAMFRFIDTTCSSYGRTTGFMDEFPDLSLLEEKIKTQLALDYRRKYTSLYNFAVGEVAIASDDFLTHGNPQITAFFELKHSFMFRVRLYDYRTRLRRRYPELVLNKFRYNDRKITSLTGRMGEVSSYLTFIKVKNGKTRKYAVMSNSLEYLKKVINTANGKIGPIANDSAFLTSRTNIQYSLSAKDRDSAFVCVSRSLQQKINSPRYRFVFEEREKRFRNLEKLENALSIFKREYPDSRTASVKTLVDKKMLAENDTAGWKDEYRYDEMSGAFVSRIFDRKGYLNFIDDISESDLPTPKLVTRSENILLDNITPAGIGLELMNNRIAFDSIVTDPPDTPIYKALRALLSRKAAKNTAQQIDWKGYLFNFRTDLFGPRIISFRASKEQVALNGMVIALKRKLRKLTKWKSRTDILAWSGKDIFVGFKELRNGFKDFLYNSKGFLAIEIKDAEQAESFLEKLEELTEASRDETNSPEENANKRVVLLDDFFFIGIYGKWIIISNDEDVFSDVMTKLSSPAESISDSTTSISLSLPVGTRSTLGRMQDKALNEFGRANTAYFSYRYGDNSPLLSARTLDGSRELTSSSAGTLFLDEDTGMATSSLFGAGRSGTHFPGRPYLPLNEGGIVLNLNGTLLKDKAEFEGTIEFELLNKPSKRSLAIPVNLSRLARRLRRTSLSELLVTVMEETDTWISSLAERRLSQLGRNALRPLLTLYFNADSAAKIRVLHSLRGMKHKHVKRHLNRLYKKMEAQPEEVQRELYRTLLHFGHQDATLDVYSHIMTRIACVWELDIVRDEKIQQLTPALVTYIMSTRNDLDGNRKFRQWQVAELAGGNTELGLCVAALSEIGRAALPEIMNNIPHADTRQKALLFLAVIGMSDLTEMDLETLRAAAEGNQVKEKFLKDIGDALGWK